MHRTIKVAVAALCALCLPHLSSRAGTFTANFDDGATPSGMTLSGVAKVVPTGGAGGTGYLSLTDAAASLSGTVSIADLDTNEIVGGFRASMKLRIGNGSGRPAD